MNPWLDVAASNIALATLLTAIAWALARWTRQPALVHTLCVLALLKLVTPPLFAWPVLPAEAAEPEPDLASTLAALEAPVATLVEAAVPAPEPAPALSPLGLGLGVWLLGAGAMLVVTRLRSRRFARLLDDGKEPSPALAHEIESLAACLGLKRVPTVTVTPGRVSPMVWPSPRGLRLVLPASLLQKLRPEQRTALLLHELAHVRRGDHWVRRLETAVSALFWWLPTLWWLRACLRDAEEQCCDAWVVWAMPARERAYADALLKTVDFLSGPCLRLPPQASGAGHLQHLKRRLTMIMEATTPRKLGAAGRTAVATLAVLFLPLLPTRAQDEPQEKQSKEEAVRAALERLEKIESKLEKIAERHGAAQQDDDDEDSGAWTDDDKRKLEEHHKMLAEKLHKAMAEGKASYLRAAPGGFGQLRKAEMSEEVHRALESAHRALSSDHVRKALELAQKAQAQGSLEQAKLYMGDATKMREFGQEMAQHARAMAKHAREVGEQAREIGEHARQQGGAFMRFAPKGEDEEHGDDDHAPRLRARGQLRRAAPEGDRGHRIEELKAKIDAMQQDMKKLTSELRRLQREDGDGDEESTR